jgi:hypothetical protein
MKNYRNFNTTKFNKAGSSFDYIEEEMEEGNAFTDALRRTKKGEKFKLGGKEYTDRSSLDEDDTIYELEVNEGDICECGGMKLEGECTECGMKESNLLEFDDEEYLRGVDDSWRPNFDDMDMDISNPDELPTFKSDGTYLGMKHSPNMDMEFDDEYPDMKIPDDKDDFKFNAPSPDYDYREDKYDDFKFNAPSPDYDYREDEDDFKSMRGRFFDKEDEEDEWGGKSKMYEYEIFNEKLGRSFRLTEEQVVNLIENLAEEKLKPTKKTRGYSEYEKSFNKSGKNNTDYYKEVGKKMKDYMKDGSKEFFNMEPDHFPMGNGELKKMDKMTYIPSDSVAEYVENFTAAALENIDYDEIGPNEEWVESNIVGSSKTGNNPKWANAVETPTNKKRNEIREKNMLAQVKRKAYNKSPQPIVKDRPGGNDASDLLDKLEKKSKKSKNVNEDLERIGQLISYDRKTQ